MLFNYYSLLKPSPPLLINDLRQPINTAIDATKDGLKKLADGYTKEFSRATQHFQEYQQYNLRALNEMTDYFFEYQKNVNKMLRIGFNIF